MHVSVRLAVSPPSLAFEMQTCKLYHDRIPKAAKMKIQQFPRENCSRMGKGKNNLHKRRSVVNFELVTLSCVRAIDLHDLRKALLLFSLLTRKVFLFNVGGLIGPLLFLWANPEER